MKHQRFDPAAALAFRDMETQPGMTIKDVESRRAGEGKRPGEPFVGTGVL